MLILDYGSGNTCQNNWDYAQRMIDTMVNISQKGRGVGPIIIKWQLFKKAGENIPLDRKIFEMAYEYARELGYQTTASIFDPDSLGFLLKFDVPFIKIANNRKLDSIVEKVNNARILKSVGKREDFNNGSCLCCVSKYPASKEDYEDTFGDKLKIGISDHTENWDLYQEYSPGIYECHFCLDDSSGLDAGTFARRPWQLEQIL